MIYACRRGAKILHRSGFSAATFATFVYTHDLGIRCKPVQLTPARVRTLLPADRVSKLLNMNRALSPLTFKGIDQTQAGDMVKVASVPCHSWQTVRERGGGNNGIHKTHTPFLSELYRAFRHDLIQ